MDKAIEVNNLKFGYDGNLILNNVGFTVNKGDYLGIIGSNGSAKSTLIKLLLGILSPLSGEIKILGENIGNFKKWDKIGYISQKANSFNNNFPATVEEVVGANLFSKVGLFNPIGKQHKELIEHALETVGMQDFKTRLVGNLSGGQQQRVFIARMLVSQPEIMFLDEPTVGIDSKSEDVVYCMLAKLNSELGITIAMVTHDIGAVTVHANKIAYMAGKNLNIHNPSENLTKEVMSELYGYGVNLQFSRHKCIDCEKYNSKEVV